jgi:hypothetical protein
MLATAHIRGILLLALVTGCASRASDKPKLPCFAFDSLRENPLTFGQLHHDAQTGEWSGVSFILGADSSGLLEASVVDARGQIPPARPVDSMYYDRHDDAIHVVYRKGESWYAHSLKPSCTVMTGVGHVYATAEERHGTVVADTFRRVIGGR